MQFVVSQISTPFILKYYYYERRDIITTYWYWRIWKNVFEDIEKYEEVNWFISISWMKKIIHRHLTEKNNKPV